MPPKLVSRDPNFGQGLKLVSRDPKFGADIFGKQLLPQLPGLKAPSPVPAPPTANPWIAAGLRTIPSIGLGAVGSLAGPIGGIAGGAIGGGLGEAAASLYERGTVNPWTVGVEAGFGAIPIGKSKSIIKAGLKSGTMSGTGQAGRNWAENKPLTENLGPAVIGGSILGAGIQKGLNKLSPPVTKELPEVKPPVSVNLKGKLEEFKKAEVEKPIKIIPANPNKYIVGPDGKPIMDQPKLQFKPDTEIPKLEEPATSPIRISQTKPDIRERIRQWDDERKSADFAGAKIKQSLSQFDKEGFDAIKNIESGSPEYKPVRDYFNSAYRRARVAFKDLKYRKDYLPLLFNESPEEVKKVLKEIEDEQIELAKEAERQGKRFVLKPRFTFERTLQDYEAGMKKGLTPKFTTVSDLAGWYEQMLTKSLADKSLVKFLKDNKVLSTKKQQGWKQVNSDYIPRSVNPKTGETTVWHAPKDVATWLNRAASPNEGWTEKFSRPFKWSKNIALSGGVPGTGLNWHGLVNIPTRAAFAEGFTHPIRAAKAYGQTLTYDLKPDLAVKYLDSNIGEAQDAVKNGLRLGAEGFWAKQERVKSPITANLAGVKEGLNRLESWMSDATFKQIIPAMKLQAYQRKTQDLIKGGMNSAGAKRAAAKFVNTHYGGLDDPTASKAAQNMASVFLLAPDWFKTKYRLAGEYAKALKDPNNPVAKSYLNSAAAMTATYLLQKYARQELTGEEEKNPRRKANIPIPALDVPNKEAELDLTGASSETIELPVRLLDQIFQGEIPADELKRFARSNTSTVGQAAASWIAGEDIYGRPLTEVDKYGNPVPAGELVKNIVGEYVLNPWTPQSIQGAIEAIPGIGRLTPLEGAATALELPVRWYKKRANSGQSLPPLKFGK